MANVPELDANRLVIFVSIFDSLVLDMFPSIKCDLWLIHIYIVLDLNQCIRPKTWQRTVDWIALHKVDVILYRLLNISAFWIDERVYGKKVVYCFNSLVLRKDVFVVLVGLVVGVIILLPMILFNNHVNLWYPIYCGVFLLFHRDIAFCNFALFCG